MFKKFLSVLLVLCMVCAFLPASIASAANSNANVSLKYTIQTGGDYYNDITSAYYGNDTANQVKLNTLTDYAQTGGFWRWADVQGTTVTAASQTRGSFYELYAQQGGWTALEIYVPVAGNYNAVLTSYVSVSTPKGCRFAYAILPASMTEAEVTEHLSTVAWSDGALSGADKVLGAINCDTADHTASTTYNPSVAVNIPTAGKYLLVFKNIEVGSNTTAPNAIVFTNLVLKNGSANVYAPMGTTNITKTEFTAANETATASVSTLYKSDARNKYTASEVTYVSSNEAVVKVSGTTVTPVGNGTAEVYAVVDGYPITGVEVSVNLPVVTAPNKDVYLNYFLQGASATAYYKEVVAEFFGSTTATQKKLNTFTDYTKSAGFWRWADVQNTDIASAAATSFGAFEFQAQQGGWTALEIFVPVEGYYDVYFTTLLSTSAPKGCRFAYTILPATMTKSEITEHMSTVSWDAETETLNGADKVFGQINCDTADYVTGTVIDVEEGVNFQSAGKYLLVMKNIEAGTNGQKNNAIVLRQLEIKNGDVTYNTGKSLPMGATNLTTTEFSGLGETATASVGSLYKSNAREAYTANSITYESSDEDVVMVSGTTVTAVGEGTAEVYAVVDGYPISGTTVTVEKYADAPTTASLFVSSNDTDVVANSAISVTIGNADAVSGGLISSVTRGTSVTVSAPEVSGNYRFKHWLGTAGIASFDAEYTFNMYTNKALLAVYEEIPAETEATVTFYKENRELVSSLVVDKGEIFGDIKPENPSLFGYNEFLGWFLGEDKEAEDAYVIEKDTEVVALFDGEVTVSGITVDGSPVGDMSYGEAETVTSNNASFSYWKRGDKIVSYNKSYTFYAWQNNASITSVNNGAVEAEPVAVLDEFGDGYMLEYEIPEGCTRLEVGIIFGDRASISVDSCFAKAVSQKTDARGFFTVSADDDLTVAKGYVIYEDAQGTVKVVYSK